jgi:hypothetical protein
VSAAARVVGLAQAPRPNAAHGGTVVHRGDAGQRTAHGPSTAWTAVRVDLAKIAPPGFAATVRPSPSRQGAIRPTAA